MHRRIAPLFLAVLVALPVVAPASAAEPLAPPAAEPATTPPPAPDPTPADQPAPSPSPSAEPTAPPDVDPAPDAGLSPPTPVVEPVGPATAPVIPDATGRYIVMLRSGSDTAAAVSRARLHAHVKADQTYTRSVRGYSAKLDRAQRTALLADPSVRAIVPDGVVQLTQTVPTGVARVGGRLSDIAAIDGTDHRVDADVAIVDTGISYHPDLNVAGGYNCSTADHAAWRDHNNHGTHVAGTIGALDNGIGVVGVAPGARVWGVKILNDDGYGLISWYICGLDWILAQRDPADASRPLFEAVNMSVTKPGSDDHNCGFTNNDPLHQAICRVVAGGITVVAAAANDHHNAAKNIPASYDEVITVSALADTDGKAGGVGGNRCYSWGTYDKDDTFANFSNYGGDVDIIAPGKCIMSTIPGARYAYMSGTSMASPTVAGAVALYKESRPNATPAEVREALRYLGNLHWATSTDPDPSHEPLLDVSRIHTLGTFDFGPATTQPRTVEAGTTASIPVTLTRSGTFFERVRLSITSLPDGWTGGPSPSSLMGWSANTGRLLVAVPAGTPLGHYQIGVQATNQGRIATRTIDVEVVVDDPTAAPPSASVQLGSRMMLNAVWADVAWPAATDPSSGIAGYELQSSRNGGAWSPSTALGPTQTHAIVLVGLETSWRFRLRAVDAAGHWSPWTLGPVAFAPHAVDDRSSAIGRSAGWAPAYALAAYERTETGSSSAGASLTMTFTGHGIAVVAPRSPHRGSAKVYIDGVYIRTIFLWSRTTTGRQAVFTRWFAGGGSHRITLRVVGSGPHPLFRLDAFVVSK